MSRKECFSFSPSSESSQPKDEFRRERCWASQKVRVRCQRFEANSVDNKLKTNAVFKGLKRYPGRRQVQSTMELIFPNLAKSPAPHPTSSPLLFSTLERVACPRYFTSLRRVMISRKPTFRKTWSENSKLRQL